MGGKNRETIRLAPRAKQIVGNLELPKRRENPHLVCLEPAQLPLKGILVVRGLSRVLPKATKQLRQKQATTLTTSDDSQLNRVPSHAYVYVMVPNFSSRCVVLPKATVLGIAEEKAESLVAAINHSDIPSIRSRDKKSHSANDDEIYSSLDNT
jgi:hypothetical protein